MQALEFSILDWIQANLRCSFLDTILPLISAVCSHGEIWILLAMALLPFQKTRRCGGALTCALVYDVIACNLLLKPLFNRVRPFALNPIITLLTQPPVDASFPSGHTAASFAAVFALMCSGSPLWKPALGLAAAIAFSRLYLYVHWPTDVLCGALLGAAAGWAGSKTMEYLRKKHSDSGRPPKNRSNF